MSKCKYLHNGLCKFTSDGEVSEACSMGPCGHESFDKTAVELAIEDLTEHLPMTPGATHKKCTLAVKTMILAIAALKSQSQAEKRFEECEWCYDNFTYSYGDSRRYDEEDGMCLNLQDWKYCPCCGKKLFKKRRKDSSALTNANIEGEGES